MHLFEASAPGKMADKVVERGSQTDDIPTKTYGAWLLSGLLDNNLAAMWQYFKLLSLEYKAKTLK